MAPGAVSGGETHAPRKTEVAATVARTEPPAAWPKRQQSSVASVRARYVKLAPWCVYCSPLGARASEIERDCSSGPKTIGAAGTSNARECHECALCDRAPTAAVHALAVAAVEALSRKVRVERRAARHERHAATAQPFA
jgi:hypothetical protein